MKDTIIQVKNVTKTFEIPHEKRNTFKSYFLNPFRKVRRDTFKAVDGVDFDVKKGEFVGIIGRNGCGKSTLLKIIAGIYAPTKGEIIQEGTLVPFLELGVGFNPELTGRENIFLNGTILGMTRKYLENRFDEIVEFAGIGEFIDLQVKNYSSGMVMRLAFSVAVEARADIYLLDEILAVGDAAFQKKSLARMGELLSGGATVLLVSHSADDVRRICDRVIFIDKGRIVFDGDVEEGLERYRVYLLTPEERNAYEKKKKQNKKS